MKHLSSRIWLCSLLGLMVVVSAFTSYSVRASAESPSKAEQTLEKINLDLKELSDALLTSTGQDKDALQLKLFQKNEELRSALASAIERDSLPKQTLISQVEINKTTHRVPVFI